MIAGLRCDNDERVWEVAYATAFVRLVQAQDITGIGQVGGAGAAYIAQDIADEAVKRLRNMREAR